MYLSSEIATWVSGAWKNSAADFSVSGISHDTRTLKAGDVYLAIRGENHDGHRFVEQAFEKGAVGAIVESEFPSLDKPQLVVQDSMAALWQMAAGVRAGWSGAVVGITGSAGKTTVKEMVASVLAQRGTVSKTLGNWNNDIGLPLSMLAADRNADFFVFELGMNHPGEIDQLAGLLKPDWALITNIGKAHIGFFPALDHIAVEKAAILKHATHAVLDPHSEWFELLKSHFSGAVTLLTERPFSANQPGAHMLQNARLAATLGLELGLSPDEVQRGLDAFENAPMRWQTIRKGGVVFINDAYNANPLSMRAAVSTFAELPCEGRKFVVFGGMRELGDGEEEEHRLLDEFIAALGFHRVIPVGDLNPSGVTKSHAVSMLRDELREGDMVLLKASRGERLETILDDF